MDLISIIIPVYNVAEFLPRCLDSVLRQSYTNFEVIIVDDGSTDDSLNICEHYSRIDDRITVFHKEHEGVGATRNFGIDNANGSFIAFIDPDDYILSNYLECLYRAINVTNCGWSMVNYEVKYMSEFIPDIEESQSVNKKDFSCTFLTMEEAIEFIFNKSRHTVWGNLYRSELLSGVRFKEYINSEDMEFNSRIIQKTKGLIFTDLPLYFYFKRTNSATYNPGIKNYVDILHATYQTYLNLKSYDERISKHPLIKLFKTILSVKYENRNYKNGELDQLQKQFYKSIACAMKNNKAVSLIIKHILFIFYRLPFTYTAFRYIATKL